MNRMKISVFCIACLVVLTLKTIAQQHQVLYRGSQERHVNFVKHVNIILDVVPIVSITVEDVMSCVFSCLRNALCVSLNVAVAPDADREYECQLLATDKYNAFNKLKSTKEFNHFSIKSFCETFPCHNGGTCRPIYEKNKYICDCVPGFVGTHCNEMVFMVGARVFALWKKKKYYKGIIDLETVDSFRIQYDDGGEMNCSKTDSRAIVMDIKPPKSALTTGMELIAWWNGSRAYYPGSVDQIDDGRYYIKYRDDGEGWASIDQVRIYNA